MAFHHKKTPPKHHQKVKKATSEILSYLEMALLFLQCNYLILLEDTMFLVGCYCSGMGYRKRYIGEAGI